MTECQYEERAWSILSKSFDQLEKDLRHWLPKNDNRFYGFSIIALSRSRKAAAQELKSHKRACTMHESQVSLDNGAGVAAGTVSAIQCRPLSQDLMNLWYPATPRKTKLPELTECKHRYTSLTDDGGWNCTNCGEQLGTIIEKPDHETVSPVLPTPATEGKVNEIRCSHFDDIRRGNDKCVCGANITNMKGWYKP